jgi:hypothetical protein
LDVSSQSIFIRREVFMRKPKDQRYPSTKPVALLILMLMFLASPMPAAATVYTYTSPSFNSSDWSYHPSWELVGLDLTIQFAYAGILPTLGGYLPDGVPFSITSGQLTMSGLTSMSQDAYIYIGAVSSSGAPESWQIFLVPAYQHPTYTWLDGYWGDVRGSAVPFVWSLAAVSWGPDPATPFMRSMYVGVDPGTWAMSAGPAGPVPLPATVLLLGSGLIPLAWARRKKRLGK